MSGRKANLLPYVDPLIKAQSMAASITGTPVNIQYQDGVGIQLVWTGSNPIGTVNVQVSLDAPFAVTWTNLQTSPGTDLVISPGGSPGQYVINAPFLTATWLRVIYTTAGGSVGNLTATITAKQA